MEEEQIKAAPVMYTEQRQGRALGAVHWITYQQQGGREGGGAQEVERAGWPSIKTGQVDCISSSSWPVNVVVITLDSI